MLSGRRADDDGHLATELSFGIRGLLKKVLQINCVYDDQADLKVANASVYIFE